MEGLIPLVYKAIKRKKSRVYYKCLSSGSALSNNAEFNANGHMFMTPPPDHHKYISSGTAGFEMAEFNTRVHGFMTPPPEKLGGSVKECRNSLVSPCRQRNGPKESLLACLEARDWNHMGNMRGRR